MSQTANIIRCTVDEANNARLKIIAKFEKYSPVKIPEISCSQIYSK